MNIAAGSRRTASTEHPTDSEVLRDVCEALERAHDVDTGTIDVSVDRGVVHLAGRVRDLAEDVRVRSAVFRVRGTAGLIDRLSTISRSGRG